MEERYFGDVLDVRFEGESGIQDDSKVSDLGRGSDHLCPSVSVCPSMQSKKSWEKGRRDLGPMKMISDLLKLSLRKLLFIKVFYFRVVGVQAGLSEDWFDGSKLNEGGTISEVREEFRMSVMSGVRLGRQALTRVEGMGSKGQVEGLMPDSILERSDFVMGEKEEKHWSARRGCEGSRSGELGGRWLAG